MPGTHAGATIDIGNGKFGLAVVGVDPATGDVHDIAGGASGGGGDASAANQVLEIAALGAPADAEATGNGSLVALAKRIRTLLGGTLAVAGTVTAQDGGGSLTVDGPLTDGQLRAAAVPVSAASLPLPAGAATEATLDARSGTLTETAPATDTASSGLNGRLQRIAQRLTTLIALLPAALVGGRLDVNLGAAPAAVTVNALPAGTNNIGDVDVLTLPALPTGDNTIGRVKVTDGTNVTAVKAASTAAAAADPSAVVAFSPNSPLPAGANAIGTVAAPAITKGAQGATGFTVQELKDAGRQSITLAWELVAGTAAAESALTNFTNGQRGGTALSAANQYTVSTSKTLRITTVICTLLENATTCIGRFRIRQAATVANTSPIIFDCVVGVFAGTAAAKQGQTIAVAIPDGIEVAAGQQITFTWFTDVNTCTVSMVILGFEY
jgi:hypothetical protein